MLYGLLLAGGKSSRMGQDKSALVHNGETLLQHAQALLNEIGADRVLLSGQLESVDCIPDIIPDAGPLGGIHAALKAIEENFSLDGSLLVIIPVDMPLLTKQALSSLLVSIGEAQSCQFENEIFPCVFRATEKLLDHLETIFSESTELGGQRSMKSLLKMFENKIVTREGLNDEIFLNINFPEDWETFSKLEGWK